MIGLTKASLYSLGNTPDDSDPLIMLVIIGNSSAQHCFKRVVGMGSRSHDLFGAQQTHDVHATFSQGCVSVGGKVTK